MAPTDHFVKDPAALLDYSWDWSDWLADITDTIESATVTVPDGLIADGLPVYGDTLVTQRVLGGILNSSYKMVCQITTVGGLIDERTITLLIADR